MSQSLSKQVRELDRELDAMVVARILGHDVTRGELSAAFDRVANRDNWKDRIDVVVDVANDVELATIREAVVFFTGSVPTFEPRPGAGLPGCRYRVRAAGYYAAVGA